ncbi:DUF3987 domain-containing protein [Streptomyces cadmiisoli]|uniref:DUF3987 domain-containing protein n=1 Tax=Streptomyces cadmiisoli TaxID=2184053 RepID=A0A2Z4J6B7_9ACTN|nr:DUF3987 domain-containing protein [Streptomyces cadmiisoli]AWW40782.1 hypothetical protein DN051_32305 [Streptomyces cadmiisoli]
MINTDRPMPDETVYTGLLGRTVQTLRPGTEADPVGVLGSLLVGFSALVGPQARVKISALDNHPALVWALLLGRTADGRKGSATSAAKAVLRLTDEQFYRQSTVSGISSGEGLIKEVEDPTAEDLELLQSVTALTGEPLVVDPDDIGDQRRFVIETEYANLMNRSAKSGSLSAVLRQAWDGDDLKTRTKKGSMTATRPHIAVLGHISPGEFRDMMRAKELAGGTYNRYLILHVHQAQLLPDGGDVDMKELKVCASALAENAALVRDQGDTLITRTKDAGEYWSDYLYAAINNENPEDETLAQFTARRAPYTLRLAALYAMADGRKQIGVRDLKAANALFRYSMESTEHTLKQSYSRAEVPAATNPLARALFQAGDDGLSVTEIREIVGKGKPRPEIDVMLEELPVDSKLRRNAQGRPSTVFYWVGDDGDGYA